MSMTFFKVFKFLLKKGIYMLKQSQAFKYQLVRLGIGPEVLKRRNIMLKEKVFEVVPWPINGFSGVGGAAIWPRHTKFVCCYTVSVGMDLIEEALYSVTAGTRGTIDSLWTITAFSLPRYDLRDGAALLKNLKWHSQDLTYGRVCRRHIDGKSRVEALEEMFSVFIKEKTAFEQPKHFIEAGLFSRQRFNKLLNSVG